MACSGVEEFKNASNTKFVNNLISILNVAIQMNKG